MAVAEGSGAEETAKVSGKQLCGLLRNLEQTQGRRAEEYARLTASFHQLLKDEDELAYRRALAEATDSFQRCSSDVRASIMLLERDGGHPEVCTLLQDMQKREQAKLKFTLILQALRAAGSQGKFSWQQPGWEGTLAEDHQHDHPQGARVEGSTACAFGASKAQEPTEEDFNGAVKEATRELQAAVTDINSILEELQYTKEEWQ